MISYFVLFTVLPFYFLPFHYLIFHFSLFTLPLKREVHSKREVSCERITLCSTCIALCLRVPTIRYLGALPKVLASEVDACGIYKAYLLKHLRREVVADGEVLKTDVSSVLSRKRVGLVVVVHDVGIRCVWRIVGVRVVHAPCVANARCGCVSI